MHLHLHTRYSVIDGRASVEDYVKLAKDNEQPGIAVTDHGTLGGIIDAYLACQKVGLKFVPGMEMYVDGMELREKNFPSHLTVLAKNEAGYRALIAANNLAHRQFYYRPRITLKQIIDGGFARDWIVLSGCQSSPFFDYDYATSEAMIRGFAPHCGGFALEVMKHESTDEQFNAKQWAYLERISEWRKRLDLTVVMTNDCHYAYEYQERFHRNMLASAHDKNGANDLEFDGEGFYFKTIKEMEKTADELGCGYAVENAKRVFDLCDVTIPEADDVKWYVPDITNGRPFEVIRELAEPKLRKLEDIYGPEYRERYDYELAVLATSPAILNSYLVTHDVVAWCMGRGIPISARGSMAGSLVSHLLGITSEDPIKYRLSFSRAVNPARPSIPDFDLDVSSFHRGEILEYLRERYEGNIPIAAYTHYGPKGALRKVMATEGLRHPKDINDLSTTMPPDWPIQYGLEYNHQTDKFELPPEVVEDIVNDPLKKAAVEVGGPEGRTHESYRVLPDWISSVPDHYIDPMYTYKGLFSNMTVHPSGVLISGPERKLEDEVPLQWIASSKTLSSAYDMYTLKKIGLFKLDVLGLQTLDQLENMKRWSGDEPPDDDYNDPQVLLGFSSDLLAEIFQMDGHTCREVLRKIRGVETFEDIIAANTLARPGCAQFTPYYRSGFEGLLREYPETQPILGPTNGLILYQEQVMEIARDVADFDDEEQDDIKESIKYFKKENWRNTIEPLFRERCEAKGVNPDHILSAIERMASYTFNRAHAMTYAAIAYKMMWYKVKYPTVYYAATFDAAADKDKLVLESHVFNVRWQPADINRSEANTSIQDGEILLGLGAIKGVGPAAIEAIKAARPFYSIEDLERRVERRKCNIKTIKCLSDAFACDSIGVAGSYADFHTAFGFPYQFMDGDASRSLWEWEQQQQSWRSGGFVTGLRSFSINKPGANFGKEMGRAEIVNIMGKRKVVIFPDAWKKLRGVMYQGAAVKLTGTAPVEGDFVVEAGEIA